MVWLLVFVALLHMAFSSTSLSSDPQSEKHTNSVFWFSEQNEQNAGLVDGRDRALSVPCLARSRGQDFKPGFGQNT